MDLESKLRLFYDKELSRIIEPLEKFRKKNADKLRFNLRVAILCIPIILIGILSYEPVLILISSIPSIFFLAGAYSQYTKMIKYLRYKYKNEVLPRALAELYEEFEYIARQKIAKKVLVRSMLFPHSVVSVKGEDFMQFRIGETHIMFCETMVTNSRHRIMFRGIFISSSFNKYFEAKTFVISRDVSNFMLRIKRQLSRELKKVYLEDIEFDKAFTVISNDQIDARYILSTSIMKRIVDYKKKIRKEISLSFVEKRLYCVIPNYKNLFEPPIFITLDFEWIKESLEPIILYTSLVEDLNLNLRIWLKK